MRDGIWHCEPPYWRIENKRLTGTSGLKTDFWRETHYGFVRDDGHFLGIEPLPAFTAQVIVEGSFEEMYDQAGLMIRLDDSQWVKAGVEYTDGALRFSTVVTKGRSDWSVSRQLGTLQRFGVRLTFENNVLRVQASSDMKAWELIRLSPFQVSEDSLDNLRVGPMFCSPERAGLQVTFSDFKLGKPLNSDLHDQN